MSEYALSTRETTFYPLRVSPVSRSRTEGKVGQEAISWVLTESQQRHKVYFRKRNIV